MSQCRLSPEADDTPCRCDNCGRETLAGELDMINDIEERLSPGCLVPAGQCPHCGSLAYYAEGRAPSWSAQAVGELLVERDKISTDALNKAESFISGFEDDETQDGVPELLTAIRAAIAGAPDDPVRRAAHEMLAVLKRLWREVDLRDAAFDTARVIAKAEGRADG